MRDIKLVAEYDGTNFVGWQMQANGRSVQQEMSKVLERILQEPVNLIGSGRTDAGVHARGQVASFRTTSAMSTASMLSALNGLLADDVHVCTVEEMPGEFNARYDAKERVYRYYVATRATAIGRHYHWLVTYGLNIVAMNAVASQIVGDHDFESFCKYDSETRHYRCTVTRSMWSAQEGKLVYEIRANRFLHGMVRALVGTMIDVGRGHTPIASFRDIMAAKDRRRAGMAAPAQGLFLEEVLY